METEMNVPHPTGTVRATGMRFWESVPKNWCFWTVVLEKTLESPLDCKGINQVNPKGNQPWIFIGRTDAEAEADTLATWCEEPTHWKIPWCWERLRAEEEVSDRGWSGWMASLNQWTWVWANSVDSEGRGILVCCSHGVEESDTTEQLNNNDHKAPLTKSPEQSHCQS